MDTVLLVVGLLFSFFVPGFCVVETFFNFLPSWVKMPLYPLLSVFLFTYSVYFLALILGLNKWVILLVIIFYLIYFLFVFWKRHNSFVVVLKEHLLAFIFAALVFLIYFFALYPGIFTKFSGYYVMSAENWQDTAMHLGIIESIAQGNFPPQAPYFSGYPLAYYYFTDFHSAIINILVGKFFPRIFVYDNPFFASIFFISVYALSFQIFRKRKTSLLSAWLSLFYGNFMFLKFFRDLFLSDKSEGFLTMAAGLISSRGYTIDFGNLLQVSSMADYFLQNRPMMVGLPTVAVVALLALYSYKRKCFQTAFLAGVISVLAYKFQMISFAVSFLVFITVFFANLLSGGKKNRKNYIKIVIFYLLPFCSLFFVLPFYRVGEKSLVETVGSSFKFGVWDKEKSLLWYLAFVVLNFGLQLLMVVFFLVFFRKKLAKLPNLIVFLFLFSFLFAAPFAFSFTIFYGDSFKLFYFSIIFASVLSSFALAEFMKNGWLKALSFLVLLFWGLTSFINLEWSALNKNYAYSEADLKAGLWIRENTPQRSVFLSLPTVHSPIDQIGGRLRVLSYINWPYSHGFNAGKDNVFSRLEDLEKVYRPDVPEEIVYEIAKRYSANYIYLGSEEKDKYPDAEKKFNSFKRLSLFYNTDEIKIYEIF